MILEYEKFKNLNGVGNESATESRVMTMSLDRKDYEAVVLRSSTSAILPTESQDTYIKFHSHQIQQNYLKFT